MKISILILTHNRPNLFNRCLNSILNNLPNNVEILVNNDSNDIIKIEHNQIKYFNYSNNDLSNIYKFLFNKAIGKYIYFLEDDDYVVSNFWKNIKELVHDIYYINYKPVDVCDLKLGNSFQIEKENNLFQLSQLIFKKELLIDFPTGNHIDNDWKLFQLLLKQTSDIKKINVPMFIQTCDGEDNISFKEYNNDERFK